MNYISSTSALNFLFILNKLQRFLNGQPFPVNLPYKKLDVISIDFVIIHQFKLNILL